MIALANSCAASHLPVQFGIAVRRTTGFTVVYGYYLTKPSGKDGVFVASGETLPATG